MACGEGCSLLYKVLESLMRWNPLYMYSYVSGRNGLRPFKHQVSLIAENAVRPVIRVLIGDEVGLGKTIEAIMLLNILHARLNRARVEPRFLIIIPKILIGQWISELRRAGVASVKILETGMDVERAAYNKEPGYYVASLQLIRKREHADKIASIPWHAIVVDEAHNIGLGASGPTLSYELVYKLTRDPERSVILLTATPHRGKTVDYIARLLLLIPGNILSDMRDMKQLKAIARSLDKTEFYKATYRSLLYRRTKELVNALEGGEDKIFKPASLKAVLVKAGHEERQFERILVRFLSRKLDEWGKDVWSERSPKGLLIALLLKRSASSAYAAWRTLSSILTNLATRTGKASNDSLEKLKAMLSSSFYDLERDPDENLEESLAGVDVKALFTQRDIDEIKVLEDLARKIKQAGESKLRALKAIIEQSIKNGKKVVVFTEYRDTLEYVYRELKREYDSRVSCISGASSGECARSNIEEVKRGLQTREIDVLVATDVASEGLNLQAANVVINYDVPWSPLKLEQRIGRVWRIGQESNVEVYNLFRNVPSELSVVDRLYMKILAIRKAVGSTKAVLGADVDVYAEGSFESIDKLYKGGVAGASDAVAEAFEEHGEIAIARGILKGGKELDRIASDILNKINALRNEIQKKSIYPVARDSEEHYALEDIGIPRSSKQLLDILFEQSKQLASLLELNNPRDAETALMVFRSALAKLSGYSMPTIKRFIAKDLERKLVIAPVIVSRNGFIVYEDLVGLLLKENETEVLKGPKLLDYIIKLVKTGVKPAPANEAPTPLLSKTFEYKYKFRMKRAVKRLVERSFERLKVLGDEISSVYYIDVSALKPDIDVDEARLIIVERGDPSLWEKPGKSPSEGLVKDFEDSESREARLNVEDKAIKLVIEYEEEHGRRAVDARRGNPFDVISMDPLTGRILRYIEVKSKSHSDYSIEIELTPNEYEFAKKHRDKYWIYLVLGVEEPKTRIIAIPDPIGKIKFRPIKKIVAREETRYVASIDANNSEKGDAGEA